MGEGGEGVLHCFINGCVIANDDLIAQLSGFTHYMSYMCVVYTYIGAGCKRGTNGLRVLLFCGKDLFVSM